MLKISEEHRASVRNRLIDAAVRVLLDSGPAAFTSRRVLEAAGLRRPVAHRRPRDHRQPHGHGLLALWRNADQFHRWRTEPDLRANGVEELLRFDSPVQLVQRIAVESIELAGTTIAPGRFVMVLTGAATTIQPGS